MVRGLGTFINVAAIVIGSLIGILAGTKLAARTQDLITDVLGLIVALAAVSALSPLWSREFLAALPQGSSLLLILGALLLGGILGSALGLENRLDSFGERLRVRFKADSAGNFVEGFVAASLLFVIGPLAILGSISDGMGEGIEQLLLKSALDFFASMAFASTLGWGVAASAIPVAIYQGLWTVAGFLIGEVLSPIQIDAMTICGGLMLIGISLRLLNIKRISVANLLPALIIAPALVGLASLL